MLRKPVNESSSAIRLWRKPCSANPKLEVDVFSEETIRPSSPTPHHLRKFKLSVFDLIAPAIYVPFIFFLPTTDGHTKTLKKLARLKYSFSKALTQFYPLAGRIKDRSFVDCNDEGALYKEARVNQDMLEFLRQPEIDLLAKFLPRNPICSEPLELAPQVAIQVNVFACGGIAIALCMFHKLSDGYIMSSFAKEWGNIARGADSGRRSIFAHNKGASIFPINEILLKAQVTSARDNFWGKEGKGSTRRFVFDAAAISALKAKSRSEDVPNPSRSEVLIGLIWKSAMKASKVLSGSSKPSAVLGSVNLRPKMVPPLPDYSVGNLFGTAIASYKPKSPDQVAEDIELRQLVALLRKSNAELGRDYVEKLKGEEGTKEIFKKLAELGRICSTEEKPVLYGVSSVVTLGFYDEVDFGWGKLLWVSFTGNSDAVYKNSIALMETPKGDGIEAWLTLDEHEMAVLEKDPEFLSCATMNPAVVPHLVSAL